MSRGRMPAGWPAARAEAGYLWGVWHRRGGRCSWAAWAPASHTWVQGSRVTSPSGQGWSPSSESSLLSVRTACTHRNCRGQGRLCGPCPQGACNITGERGRRERGYRGNTGRISERNRVGELKAATKQLLRQDRGAGKESEKTDVAAREEGSDRPLTIRGKRRQWDEDNSKISSLGDWETEDL